MTMADSIQQTFVQLIQDRGLELNETQLQQFETYYRILVEWNEKINLTAITDRDQVYIKHFYDSLSPSFFVNMSEINNLADIGSGAGFPSIPLKIVYPHLRITIIDSLNKRISFLRHVTEQLKLQDVDCLHARAEDAGRNPSLRDSFDVVTARAVARLPILNEFCLPFVRVGGTFIALKGSDADGEIQESAYSLRQLRATLTAEHVFELPFSYGARRLIVIGKKDRTPSMYPRKPGVPLKSPLIRNE